MIGFIQRIVKEEEREIAGKSYHYEICSLLTAFFGNKKIRETEENVSFVLKFTLDGDQVQFCIEEQQEEKKKVLAL